MKTAKRLLLILVLAGVTPVLQAETYSQEEYLALIEQYVDRVTNIYDGTWAYSYTSHDMIDGDSLTRRVDPSRPFMQSEILLAENGGPPSAEGLARQERRMERRLRREHEDQGRSMVEEERAREGSEKERFLNLIIPDSIRLVEQDGHLHTLEFRGMEEERRKIYEHLTGRLVLDTKQGFIRELLVEVTEPFSPFLFTYVNEGFFSLRFELRDGTPVQSDADWQLDGHILYIKSLERDNLVEWFDLVRVLPEAAG